MASGALARSGAEGVPVEEQLHVTILPWMDRSRVHFRMDVGTAISRDTPDIVCRRAAEDHLADLPGVWSDGSAEGDDDENMSDGSARSVT